MRRFFARCSEIKIGLGAIPFGEFGIHRIRDILVPAFPRCARAGALLRSWPGRKPVSIELEPEVANSIFDKVERQPVRVIELKCFVTRQYSSTLGSQLFLGQNRASTERKEDTFELVLAHKQAVAKRISSLRTIIANGARDSIDSSGYASRIRERTRRPFLTKKWFIRAETSSVSNPRRIIFRRT